MSDHPEKKRTSRWWSHANEKTKLKKSHVIKWQLITIMAYLNLAHCLTIFNGIAFLLYGLIILFITSACVDTHWSIYLTKSLSLPILGGWSFIVTRILSIGMWIKSTNLLFVVNMCFKWEIVKSSSFPILEFLHEKGSKGKDVATWRQWIDCH